MTDIREVAGSEVVVLMERLHAPQDKKAPTTCSCCGVDYPCATIELLDGCDIAGDWHPDDHQVAGARDRQIEAVASS